MAVKFHSQQEEYYTVQEVAERFKVSDKAVYKWVDQNKIQYERSSENSRDIRIPKAQFKNPSSKATVNRREHELFKGAIEMKLVRRYT
jgi:excisionase family DNA binding protein